MCDVTVIRHVRRLLATMAFIGILGSQTARAVDEVVLQSTGESIKGTIASVSTTEVEVQQTAKLVTIPVTDIAEIRWDGEPAELNITRIRERNGDLEEALKSYQSFVGSVDASKENLKTDLEYLIARTLARQAVNDPAKKDAAVESLNSFITNHEDSIRYFDALQWLGRVHLAAGEFGPAKDAYQRLAEAPLPELKMAGNNALGRVKLQEGDLAGATAAFEKVLQAGGEGPAALRQQFAAQLGKALVLQEQGNQQDHEAALVILDDVIAKASPSNEAVHAEAFVRKGTSLELLGKTNGALLAFLHVEILFANQPEAHAEALYHLTKLWETVGKIERSAEARSKLTERYPASEWAKKL